MSSHCMEDGNCISLFICSLVNSAKTNRKFESDALSLDEMPKLGLAFRRGCFVPWVAGWMKLDFLVLHPSHAVVLQHSLRGCTSGCSWVCVVYLELCTHKPAGQGALLLGWVLLSSISSSWACCSLSWFRYSSSIPLLFIKFIGTSWSLKFVANLVEAGQWIWKVLVGLGQEDISQKALGQTAGRHQLQFGIEWGDNKLEKAQIISLPFIKSTRDFGRDQSISYRCWSKTLIKWGSHSK